VLLSVQATHVGVVHFMVPKDYTLQVSILGFLLPQELTTAQHLYDIVHCCALATARLSRVITHLTDI
jgi:hypothetical protein